MYLDVKKLCLAVADGFLLRDVMDRKYGPVLRTPYVLTLLLKVFLWFNGNLSWVNFIVYTCQWQSTIFYCLSYKILYTLKSIIIYSLAFSFLD